ncbi:secretoglobin family 1D member 2-like [Perognathus longimembris pacificus]|uniref:secretoglobin family 1D member 2-like n=1 Tax=Perognathus longimembris pacificus TaxID=214514 RepID=UPI0020192790|nr:secretoglobin family 1D member 2-like [Perognathus longimembris pacificus]
MRLLVSLLLVTLALCCYEAHAKADTRPCPHILAENFNFLFGTEKSLRKQLGIYNAPPGAPEALLKVKECTDNMSIKERVLVSLALVIPFSFMH